MFQARYIYIWATSLIAIGPIFALGRIPHDFDTRPVINGNNHAIVGLRVLSDYLAAPLLAIYALILHAYALKILITGEVPEGQIGWMVIGFGTLIIFFWKLMLPLKDVLTASGKLFLKYWPLFVIVPMALLGYAVFLRIGTYGVTPERYFLAAFGALMTVIAIMQAVPVTRNWLQASASLTVVVLFIGSFGPWGAEKISINSQFRQFVELLDDKYQVKSKQGNRAKNLLNFLSKHNGVVLLRSITKNFPDDPLASDNKFSSYSLGEKLKIAFNAKAARNNFYLEFNHWRYKFSRDLVSVTGYDLYLHFKSLDHNQVRYNGGALSGKYKIVLTSESIKVTYGNQNAVFSLEQLRGYIDKSSNQPKARGFELISGTRKILLVPSTLLLKVSSKIEFVSGSGSVFLRKSDWQ